MSNHSTKSIPQPTRAKNVGRHVRRSQATRCAATTSGLDFRRKPLVDAIAKARGAGARWTISKRVRGVGLTLCLLGTAVPAMGEPFPAALELSSLDGSNGFVLNGVAADDFSGRSVSTAGDVNGDGLDDLLIGAFSANPNGSESGASYLVFGSSEVFGTPLELSTLDGSNGFVHNGVAAYDDSGYSVSAAGDFNGDGLDDMLIGASGAGVTYVVFGSREAFGAALELSTLDGSNGVAAVDSAGYSVSAAGDVNGDGIDDLLIAAPGVSYVVFGSREPFGAAIELSTLDGSDGFVINGVAASDSAGRSVSAAGDVNGDGIDDLLIGAFYADPNGSRSGASYVVFGSREAFGATLELSTLDGSNGFVLNGVAAGDRSGGSVSAAGDVNGDGIDDLLIGAYTADTNGSNSGASYVVFGSREAFGAALELSTLDGSNGFVLNGVAAGDLSGGSVSAAGDVNGDGIDDLLIGALGADSNGFSTGASYVVFGSREAFGAALELSTLDGNDGFVINGVAVGDRSGGSVSAAGDVNGDGLDDLLIGAYTADSNGSQSGASYVVFGQMSDLAINCDPDTPGAIIGTSGDDGLIGTPGDDVIIGLEGNDSIVGRGGNDCIAGGVGADRIIAGAGNDEIDGGPGNDRIVGDRGDDRILAGEGNDTVIAGSGDDSVEGGQGDDRVFGGSGNDDLDGGSDNDLIIGGSGIDTCANGELVLQCE